MIVSSRTPEGEPNRCDVCKAEFRVDPSRPLGDATCPNCGCLCFFLAPKSKVANSSDGTSFSEILKQFETKKPPATLLVNFQGVSFMSSRMIRQLVQLNKEVRARGGKLVCCNVNRNVREVFKITKLNKLLHFLEN